MQLMGQTSTSPFMNIRDGIDRKVSFNARDELGDKIDKLTVIMSRLAAKDSYKKDPSNPKYIKEEVRIGPIIKEVIRIEVVGQTVETEDSTGIIDLDKTIETTFFEGKLEDMEDKMAEEDIGIIGAMIIIEAGIGPEKKTCSRNYGNNRDRSSSNSRSRTVSRASTNRDRIRCYNCREYDHFVRDCPNSREERDLEQLQQILNMEAKKQTHLLTKRQDSLT